MSIPDHLITPLDWSAEALRHAKWAGQPARDRAFIESKRYLATHELIERLRAELAQAREVLRSVEWSDMPAYYGTATRCPLCGELESEGHEPIDGIAWLCVSSAPVYSHEQMRAAAAEADALRRERNALAARLAEIERVTPQMVEAGERAWIHKERDMSAPTPTEFFDGGPAEACYYAMLHAAKLCARPAPSAAPVLADESPRPAGWKAVPVDPTPEMIDAADSVDWRDDDTRGSVINMWNCMLAVAPEQAEPVGGCSACGDACRQRASCRLADESPRPADPRTPPPGCRLLGDYEPAQAGDMAYIGSIGGRWRPVRPRMGIIGATMDELSDSARVLALARPCRCGPDSRSDSTSCPRGVMTISVYYFCAEYRDDQLTHSMSGTIQSDMPPFHEDFHARLTERIAANMKPPRPADLVSVRSLSLLATREVEHGDVWARQSGRDDGGHAEHDGTDADAERAYCAAAVGACGRASHE